MRGEFIDIGDHRLYYYAAGTRGQGDPIVLIHGIPTSGRLWSNLVSLLPSGRRVLVPDLLGHGRSDHPAGADLSIAGHAASVVGLMDALGIARIGVVGHHVGALVAASIATSHPSRVSHLAMLNPLGGDVTFTGTLAVIRAFLPVMRLVPAPVVRVWIHRELCRWYNDASRGRLAVDQYVRSLSAPARWPAFLRQLRALEASEVAACTHTLSQLTIPVAIVAGSRDPAVPAEAVECLRRALPQATLDIVRDGRHFTPDESPEQVARIISRLLGS